MIYQINSIALSRLTNAAHVAFMSNVKAYINLQEAEVMGIDEKTFKDYEASLKKEQDIVNRSRASMYTSMMKDYDEKRNNYFRRLYYKLLAVQYDTENPDVEADVIALIESDLLSQYTLSICNARAQDKTAKIRGFLLDIDNKIGGLIEALGLEKDMAALEKANNDYESAYLSRVSERTISVETAAIRTATEELYHKLCFNLCYLANKEGADASERAKVQICQRVVEIFNQLVKEFRQKINSNGESINGDADDLDPDDDFELENPSQEQTPSQNQTPPPSGDSNDDGPIFN